MRLFHKQECKYSSRHWSCLPTLLSFVAKRFSDRSIFWKNYFVRAPGISKDSFLLVFLFSLFNMFLLLAIYDFTPPGKKGALSSIPLLLPPTLWSLRELIRSLDWSRKSGIQPRAVFAYGGTRPACVLALHQTWMSTKPHFPLSWILKELVLVSIFLLIFFPSFLPPLPLGFPEGKRLSFITEVTTSGLWVWWSTAFLVASWPPIKLL